MVGVGEHVNRADALDAVAVVHEVLDVANLRLGIAADVDDAARPQAAEVCQEGLAGAGAGRVHEHDVELLAATGHAGELAASVGGHERGVLDAVDLGVDLGVLHGLGVALDADELGAARLGCHDADGARAAVGVADAVGAAQVGHLDGQLVEGLRGDGVGLVERARGDAEAALAQLILDVARAEEHLLLLAQDDARALGVGVEHDRGDLGVGAQDGVDERLGQRGRVAHEREHDLVGGMGDAHEGIAHGARAGLLAVGGHAVIGHETGDRADDGTGGGIFDHALLAGHDPVAALLKDAPAHGGVAVLVLAGSQGQLHLVAVAARVDHAHERLDLDGVVGEELLDVVLLALELHVVGHGEPLAAAAALGNGAVHGHALVEQLVVVVLLGRLRGLIFLVGPAVGALIALKGEAVVEAAALVVAGRLPVVAVVVVKFVAHMVLSPFGPCTPVCDGRVRHARGAPACGLLRVGRMLGAVYQAWASPSWPSCVCTVSAWAALSGFSCSACACCCLSRYSARIFSVRSLYSSMRLFIARMSMVLPSLARRMRLL